MATNNFKIIFITIFILSSFLYINLAIAQKYGESHFYSVIEHLVVFIYSVLSFVITDKFITYSQQSPTKLSIKNYLKIIFYSGVVATFISSSIWMVFRYLAFYIAGKSGWFISWSSIIPNALFIFFYIHLVISGCYLAYHYLERVNTAEINRVIAEKATDKAKFQLLQKQITPHFLFNNLNVLSSLITINPKLAESYVTKFSDLYRYMLRNKECDLVSLVEEIDFVKNYLDLINIRFNDVYKLSLKHIETVGEYAMVVPCALQTLVENVIKHNNAEPASPLDICIDIKDGYIEVENQIRSKSNYVNSTGTGLDNLKKRYKSLSFKKVIITQTEHSFCVKIPLLEEVYEDSHY